MKKGLLTRENDGCQTVMMPESEDTVSMSSSQVVLDQVDVAFDDERSVAGAGLLLPATLVERLGIQQGAEQLVDLGDRPGRPAPGAGCSPWSTPWSPAGTALTTWCAARRHDTGWDARAHRRPVAAGR
jgi:hypothetical protein